MLEKSSRGSFTILRERGFGYFKLPRGLTQTRLPPPLMRSSSPRQVNTVIGDEVSRTLVLEQLFRLLESPVFSRSDRLSRFLKYTIERALDGAAEELKEYTIGIEVYDRKPPYHPSQDSIVRTEARRLRAKLKEYYEGDGRTDALQIIYHPGSYAPVLRYIEPPAMSSPRDEASATASTMAIKIAILPFSDGTGTARTGAFARSLTDELVHLVSRTEGCRAVPVRSAAELPYTATSGSELIRELGAHLIIEGNVTEYAGRMRATFRITSSYGLELWSEKMEGRPEASESIDLGEQMALACIGRLELHSCGARRHLHSTTSRAAIGVNPEILAAEALLDKGDRSSVQNALSRFGRVEKEIVHCATRAACGMALSHYTLALSDSTAQNRAEAAETAARGALLRDAEMIMAHAAYACGMTLRWELGAAEEQYRRAMRLGPSAPAARLFGDLLLARGSFDEAEQYLRVAQRTDPFSYRQKSSFSRFLYVSGRYTEALTYFAEPLKYGPLPTDSIYYQALILIELGETEVASRLATELQRDAGGDRLVLHKAAEIMALSGDRCQAQDIIVNFHLHSDDAPISQAQRGLLSLALGDLGRARSYLCSALASKELELIWLRADPRCRKIRDVEGFSGLFDAFPR